MYAPMAANRRRDNRTEARKEAQMIAYCQDCDTFPAVARGRCRECYEVYRLSPEFVRIKPLARPPCRTCGTPAQAGGLCGKHWIAERRAKERAERAGKT